MKNLMFFTLCSFLFAGCSKDEPAEEPIAIEEPTNPVAELTFVQVIAAGGDFEPYPASRTEEVLAESAPMNEDYEREEEGGGTVTERSVCVTKTVSVLDGNGTFPLFNTNADVIYPGSLLQGKTLSDATPKPIVVGRAGGTISYDLNNGNTNSTFTVNEVSKSSIQDGMNNIIANAGQVVPANFQVDIIQVESESQMALEMGIKVETFTTEVEGSLSFSTEKEYNRTLVKVNQSYYTMSFDLPTSLDEIFGENVTPEQLQTYVKSDNPATFISSVTYGRIFYMLIESTSSRQEMQASLKATYDAAAINASGSLDVETFDSLKEVKIKAIAYGGDAEGSFQLLGETSIAAIANKIGASTDIKAGLPLSYVVRSVERPDEIVGVKLATEYDIVNCEVKGILPPTVYLPLVDIFEDGIGAAFQLSGTTIVLYNKAGDKYAYYNVGSGVAPSIYAVSDEFGPIFPGHGSNSTTGPIGAAVRWGEERIHLFNMDGTKFLNFEYDPSFVNNVVGQIERNPDGSYKIYETSTFYAATLNPWTSFPFANDGIDAAIQYSENATQRYFSNDGKSTTLLEFDLTLNRWVWSDIKAPNASTLFGTDFFESVGAATKVQFGPTTLEIIYFNGDGDQMIIQTQPNTFNGPYFIN